MNDQAPADTSPMDRVRDLSHEELDALAEQFERDTGRSIERWKFRHTILDGIREYRWSLNPRAFEHAWTKRRLPAASKTSRAAQKAAVRFRSKLYDALDAHLLLLTAEDRAQTYPSWPANELRDIIKQLDDIEETLAKHVAKCRKPTGRPFNFFWNEAIECFGFGFWLATDENTTTSTQRGRDDRGGDFVDFVSSILEKIDPGCDRAGLGNRIEAGLRAMRNKTRREMADKLIPPKT